MPRRTNKFLDTVVEFGLDDSFLGVIQSYLTNGDNVPPLSKALHDRLSFFLAARSNAEVRWNQASRAIILATLGSEVYFDGYEWMTFKVPGGSYTPDRSCLLKDGRWIFIEIKGSKKQINYRDARSKLRSAAALNPWFTFYEAIVDRFGITLEEIKPEIGYVNDLISGGKNE